jgi:hypothetical protein
MLPSGEKIFGSLNALLIPKYSCGFYCIAKHSLEKICKRDISKVPEDVAFVVWWQR